MCTLCPFKRLLAFAFFLISVVKKLKGVKVKIKTGYYFELYHTSEIPLQNRLKPPISVRVQNSQHGKWTSTSLVTVPSQLIQLNWLQSARRFVRPASKEKRENIPRLLWCLNFIERKKYSTLWFNLPLVPFVHVTTPRTTNAWWKVNYGLEHKFSHMGNGLLNGTKFMWFPFFRCPKITFIHCSWTKYEQKSLCADKKGIF